MGIADEGWRDRDPSLEVYQQGASVGDDLKQRRFAYARRRGRGPTREMNPLGVTVAKGQSQNELVDVEMSEGGPSQAKHQLDVPVEDARRRRRRYRHGGGRRGPLPRDEPIGNACRR